MEVERNQRAHRSHLSRLRYPHRKDDLRELLQTIENPKRTNALGKPCYYSFEDADKCRARDDARQRGARQAVATLELKRQRNAVRRLATSLTFETDQTPPESRASAVYMRDLRLRLVGELLRLHRKQFPEMVCITIMSDKWLLEPKAMNARALQRIVRELENYLCGKEFRGASGFVIASLDGEFCQRSGLFGPHFHVAATGEYAELIMRVLKQKQAFKSRGAGHSPIRKSVINDPAAQLSYIVKAAWTYRYKHDDAFAKNGVDPKSYSMPSPFESLYLSALNDMRVGDTFVMKNCYISRGKIVVKS